MYLFLTKLKNSFLTPRLYCYIVNDDFYEKYEKNFKKNNLLKKIFLKIFYFYPNLNDTYEWKFGSATRNTNFFDKYQKRDIFILNFILKKIKNKKSKIFDLGCNQGRHLRYLHNKRFTNLYGVDIMKKAGIKFINKSTKTEKKNIRIEIDYLQRNLNKTQDNFYFASYTFGATIELIHPSFDIIKELIRVSKKYIFLYINENDHWYPRFYTYEFKNNNTKILYKKRFGANTFFFLKKISK